MKAVVCNKYCSPESVYLTEIKKPVPGDNEALVKVDASCVNYNTLLQVTGKPILVRFMGLGVLKPKVKIPGSDIAGCIEAVGKNVKRYRPGDKVYAEIGRCGYGALAEYTCVTEDMLARMPHNMSFEDAAAVPQAALVALQAVRKDGCVKKGQKVLIYGASGGIGTFAVQIAKALGAEVTGICSTKNLEMVRSIGADNVIDYTQEDFVRNGPLYDLIVATAGYRWIYDYEKALKPNGIYVATGGSMKGSKAMRQIFEPMILGKRITKKTGKKFIACNVKVRQEDLAFLTELIEAGKVRPVIDRRVPFSNVREALMYYEKGHSRGKVVITMS